jgi:cytochrome c oxidase subunit 2
VRPLRRHSPFTARQAWRRLALATLAVGCAVSLSGCGAAFRRGYLPVGVTAEAPRVQHLWVWSWIAALAVGIVVWGLVIWCVVAYRRGKDEVGLPVQLRYNVPIEILYTVIPLFMVGVLFFFTAKDEAFLLDNSKKPDVTINVVGKRWSWDFNYTTANTYESGTQAELTGKDGVSATLPTLYLPVNKRVQFVLTARDVIHSFWVPQFLQKLDMIPGRVNKFQVVPTQVGTFAGKCAELCGAYHSDMLFQVKVVPQQEYDAHVAALKAAGNVGALDNSLNQVPLEHNPQQWVPNGVDNPGSNN